MMKRLLFTILALCGLFVGLQAQITNTPNQKGVTTTGQLDTVRNTRVQPTTQDVPIQSNFVDQFGKTGQRPGLSPYGQRLNAVVKVTSSSIVSNSVAATTAYIAVTVSDSGDYVLPVIERGVCYGLEENPTLLTATKVSDTTISGKGFGNFNVTLSGLQPHTAYHARAYAVSMYDTVYGEDLTFTTLLVGSISYATTAVEKLSVDVAFTNPLTHTGDGTVAYAVSSGDDICTVNAGTGLVTLNGNAGTCIITATVTGGTDYAYAPNTASYTLMVSIATALQTPLTFEAKEAGAVVSFGMYYPDYPQPATVTIEYSKNGGEWTTYASSITLENVGDKVSFRGNNTKYNPNMFYCSDTCYIYGNIMSLISSEGYATATTLTESYAFSYLFSRNSKIYSHASKTLVLPAITLSSNCYSNMFYGCTGLTTAPELPATTMAGYCYSYMFDGCTGLKTAPELPAETLAEGCYSDMFNGCTSLTQAPALPAETLAESCYTSMFSGCTSLESAPALPAMTMTDYCYQSMFSGCSSLATAPALPATSLATQCYVGMFRDCTNLTAAPALPATTLANFCYDGMFKGCTSLTTAPVLPAKTLIWYCYQYMFKGCENLNSVTCLATDISAEGCTNEWLDGVASEGTFTAASTNWPISTSGIPSGWIKILDLSKVTGNQEVPDGWIITNALAGNYKISIADGATVTLAGVDINGSGTWTSGNYAGLNCVGNATITLADGTTNTVKGFENHYPSIHVPSGSTLTIQGETAGTGTLNAIKNQYSAGIGCGYNIGCGNITINSGTITATEGLGTRGAGIGGCNNSSCGDITINGGTITAQGGSGGAGIGCGGYPGYTSSHCGNITINGGIVTAYAGSAGGAAGIGSAGDPSSSCGDITIMSTVTRVTATKGAGATNSIGKGSSSSTCGTVTFGNATVYNGSAWSPNPMVAGNYGGLMLAISTTTNSKDTWTLTPCLFSVSSSEKVYFSQGNLQATTTDLGANWSWAFAENQWDYIGHAASNNCISGNGTVSTNGTVDLFGWVGASSTWTGAAQYGIINSIAINNTNGYGNVANEALKSDWGNTIGMGWRTLTKDEWTYLFITRTSGSNINGTSNARYTQATINTDNGSGGVYGMILFPDGVTIAAEETTAWGTINGNSDWDTDTKCTSAQWTALAAKGCVFLPAAGYRHLTTVGNDSSEGYYWSSSPSTSSENEAYLVFFNFAGSLNIVDNMRFYGYSVRLVHTTKPMGSLSYPTTSMNKMTTDAAFTNPLTFEGDGTVTYSKSGDNNNICTVNAATGEVTLNGTAGTCTITATVTNCSLYAYTPNTASYTLTVLTLQQIPLTLEATTAGTIKVNSPRSGMQYSKNDGAKTTMTETTTINVAVGDKVQFFGNGTSITRYYKNSADFTYIADGTAQVKAYGNIMSLVDETAYATATTLTNDNNFRSLFDGNSTLTDASGLLLPATTLANDCYYGMFKNCTSLTTAPALPATTLKNKCYYEMFKGCSNLNSVTCLATDISAPECTRDWLSGVAATGIFATPSSTNWGNGASGIPNGWTRVEDMMLVTPLTFEVKTAGAKVTFNIASGVTGLVEYSTNGSTWNSYTSGTEITLTNVGDKVSFRGNNAAYASSSSNYSTFSCSDDCYIYGNVMSLVNKTEYADVKTLASNYAFCRLFYQNTHIVNHPSKTLILPATSIVSHCYQEMFYGCTNLTKAPELPATTLATNCYNNMFYGCTNLTKAPVLPATTLANGCYRSMFAGCTSLTVAPALPATTLTTDCYNSMFDSCTSLTTAPTLPAKTTVQDCYTYMFRNCSNLNSVTCSATPNSSNTHNWLYNAATSGTFYKAPTESWSSDASGIPSGWTVVDAVIDLSTVTTNTIVPNGWTATGTLARSVKISIAHGAIVTLHNVDINGSGSLNGSFAGITCEGDATIILSGTNTVRGFKPSYSGIQAGRYSSEPNPATLIIQGTGSLTAIGGNYGAGIGSSCSSSNRCGNIIINGGTITATGGQKGAGIGSSFDNSYCGNITINGGTIEALGGNEGCAGIGSGCGNSHCGNITISGGTVTAMGSGNGAGIGTGYSNSYCGNITISGGTVTATGSSIGAGIGTATDNSYCGDITITNTVTHVTATKGDNATNCIGNGGSSGGSCGTVTIGGNVGAISTSPYTYQP